MALGKMESGNPAKRVFPVLACIILLCIAHGIFLAGNTPSVGITMDRPAIGVETPFRVDVSESRRGLTYVKGELVQGDRSAILFEKKYPETSQFMPWRSKTISDTITGTAGRRHVPNLQEGNAVIRVTAGRASTWLRHPDPEVYEISLPVRLRPPSLQVLSTHTYISQGGCELVVYRVGETSQRDGVEAGDWWFPGYPLPGGEAGDRFALFAAPYDMSRTDIRLLAVDDAGNRAEKDFIDQFHPKSFKTDTLYISDTFLSGVVPDIIAQSPGFEDRGNLLENYVAINRELRDKNTETIKTIARESRPEFLWSRPFLMLPNSKVTATFGEKRTYQYQGKTIDRQTHLGYDLASVRQAAIPAPNDSIVLFAGFLGIYGNTVLLDHGYGLMTIFGHLSSISVSEGQQLSRGDVIGRTGSTGLAGGDHLHYCTLLQGLPVNPIEWSDGHWIRDRIARKLGAAFSFSE